MRLNLTFTRSNTESLLPLNYQYEIGAWVYRTLDLADHAFTRRLHEGDCLRGFTFSNLRLEKFTLLTHVECLKVEGETIGLTVAFADYEVALLFCQGLKMRPQMRLASSVGEACFDLATIEKESLPIYRTHMRYRTVSPLNITLKKVVNDRLKQHYMSPDEGGFAEAFAQSLCQKHRQLTGETIDPATIQFRLLSVPKSRLITIRAGKPQETRVRGYVFEFDLVAPPALHRTGFLSGFGEKGSMGFGCVAMAEAQRKRVVMEEGKRYERLNSL